MLIKLSIYSHGEVPKVTYGQDQGKETNFGVGLEDLGSTTTLTGWSGSFLQGCAPNVSLVSLQFWYFSNDKVMALS